MQKCMDDNCIPAAISFAHHVSSHVHPVTIMYLHQFFFFKLHNSVELSQLINSQIDINQLATTNNCLNNFS